MDSQDVVMRLAHKGVGATANRILVYRELAGARGPLSLADLERKLLSLEKSSIFRVLTLFLEHGVVHTFADGRGVQHYELCGCEGECDFADSHVHFYCEQCQRSYCLEDIRLPDIELPEGFKPHSISFVIKGVCPECGNP